MLNFTYVTPKEEKKGRRSDETVESTSKHIFKDINRDVVNDELAKLMARYPDYDFELSIKFKKSRKK